MTKHLCCLVIVFLSSWIAWGAPDNTGNHQPLWQIGSFDNSDAEFALAPGAYTNFSGNFGRPEHAFYIGLSNPQTDWPYVLPGMDGWAGSREKRVRGLTWDEMNTLPVGFVLNGVSHEGQCVLTITFCDCSPKSPPHLRVTVNGKIFERDLLPGGSDRSLTGDLGQAKPQTIQIKFPASLLRAGYNEIALRTTTGSWCLFDALRLDASEDITLAPSSQTIIRSVTTPPYAVSSDKKTQATVRVEVFCGSSAGKLKVQIGKEKARNVALQPGLQALEIPAPASKEGEFTRILLSADRHTLYEGDLKLQACPPVTPADYVDVFMGTAHSRWMIAPGPWMPFSMVKIAPDNQPQCQFGGYEYTYDHIDCFSQIHEWTMAGLGMMPIVGPLRTHPGLGKTGYSSRFDKTTERGGIGYYEVFLKDSGINVELAATTRASLQRYTFPASDEARVMMPLLLPNEYDMHVIGASVRRSGTNEIEGDIQTCFTHVSMGTGHWGDQHFILHFVSQFSRAFDELGGWQNLGGSNITIQLGTTRPAEESNGWHGGEIFSNVQELAMSGDCGAFVNFQTTNGEKIQVRTGISLVSLDDARQNLEEELSRPFGWNFRAVVENQRQAWNELFSSVEIETPDAREKTRFYSNFYRAMSGRNTWSDWNGKWIDPFGHEQQLVDPDNVMLGCDALWNSFWNLNQVMNLLAPEWSARWTKSELQLYEKCGWLAKGPAGLKYLSIMTGEHEIPLMVAACQAGIPDLNPQEILSAAVKMQTSLPQDTANGGRVGDEYMQAYLQYGYVPYGGTIPYNGPLNGKTSDTDEYAYDDWTVAQLALALRQTDTAKKFLKRSQNWRNTFDPQTGFARPRGTNGVWASPFDGYSYSGFREGNAWQYTWFVPQDVPGLIDAMGRDRFLNRLNDGFEESAPLRFNAINGSDHSYLVDQGNEQDMQLSWLFNWVGAPWLTQKWTRGILDSYYGSNPGDAYLGDEDQGQMAAWFVMSAMGLFQTDGGCDPNPYYEIASPLYPKITIHLSKKYYGGKTFTIEAHNASPTNIYIQSATLNGKPLNQWWISQKDVLKGGSLVLELGPEPNKEWAKGCPFPNS